MLVYRVVPYVSTARDGEPGSPTYLHPDQGASRLDNPSHYKVWYLAQDASGAIGETFGNLAHWSEDMFVYPRLSDSRRSLVTFQLPDDVPLLDLDDAKVLAARGLRPTQVVERNRAATQAWALDIFLERNNLGKRTWSGVRWWSYHRPQWRIIGYWEETPPAVLNVEDLDLQHPSVIDAASALKRHLPKTAKATSYATKAAKSTAAASRRVRAK